MAHLREVPVNPCLVVRLIQIMGVRLQSLLQNEFEAEVKVVFDFGLAVVEELSDSFRFVGVFIGVFDELTLLVEVKLAVIFPASLRLKLTSVEVN